MDHGSMEMGSGETASLESLIFGEYSDERFIDKRDAYYQMAINTCRVAQENAELEEIRRIADDVTTAQQAEIDEFASIKEERFGS